MGRSKRGNADRGDRSAVGWYGARVSRESRNESREPDPAEPLGEHWDDASVVSLASAWRTRRGLAWLDGDGSKAGRWSWLACDPIEMVEVPAGSSILEALPRLEGSNTTVSDVPRWIGWIAYDALFDGALDGTRPRRPRRHARVEPVMRFGRYAWVVGIDHDTHAAWLFAESAEARADGWRALEAVPGGAPVAKVTDLVATSAEGHRAAIERSREAIARGELYQVNLARKWEARFSGDPLALALAMREASPVPLGIYLRGGKDTLIGRSMERFLAWDGEVLETRPIKGTLVRRGDDAKEAQALLSDDKERAEHAMIVDLLRNDLARVARTGSVEVVDPLKVEPYAGLHHLVSTVRCRTRPEVGLAEVLGATFPPGSITGAPKVAAVERIEAEEPFPRGVYCGAYGYVTRRGRLSLAVAIRTAWVAENHVRYFAGGGIVWPSDPAREVAETELKARVFLDAVSRMNDG